MQRAPVQSFSTTEALDLLRQGNGSAYFVPSGYIPILVPDNDDEQDFIRRLLEAHVPTQVPVENLWQTRLPTKVMRAKRKRGDRVGPARKPPRPPNAFILYRKDKQKSVQEREIGITNNEVSKVIGDMWKQESKEVKDHYQALAQQSREQHQKEYPGYKYTPRRPGERKRRGVQQEIVYNDYETGSNTGDDSISGMDLKSPTDYSMSPVPGSIPNGGDYFRFTSGATYYHDMLGMPGSVESSPDEFNLSQMHPSQQTPCLTAGPDVEHCWGQTPNMDHAPDLNLDAGHPEMGFGDENAYGIYQGTIPQFKALIADNTFEREPVRFHSVAAENTYKYLNTPATSTTTVASPMEWNNATTQALVVEDIYSGSSEWMNSPLTVNQTS